jgi:esterase/lipase superfamily enzyme
MISDNNTLILKKRVMRRIYAIWFLRKATSPIFVKTGIFLLFVLAASYYISFIDIIKNVFNSSGSFSSFSSYIVNSFIFADILSQILTIGILVTAGFVFRDFVVSNK